MEANHGKWIRPGHVIMTVHPAIETADLDKAAQKQLAETVRQAVLDAREDGRRWYEEQTNPPSVQQQVEGA